MPTTKFGMKLPLAGKHAWPNVKQGEFAAIDKVNFAFDEFYPRAVKTIDTFTQEGAPTPSGVYRLAQPYVTARVMPEGVYLDQVCVLMDATDAQTWQATNFNLYKYRDNIKSVIHTAMDAWARGDFKHYYRADHLNCGVFDKMPTS